MTSEDSDDDVQRQLSELTETLEQLQQELERPRQRRRPLLPPPPSMTELRRFASEVAIPGLILVLETNVRTLKLLQRTLRLAEDGSRAGENASAVTRQASDLGATALARLEDALTDAQSALEGEPQDSEARKLLEDARDLRADIHAQLEAGADTDGDETDDSGPQVDVEAELQSIKDQVDGDDGDTDENDDE